MVETVKMNFQGNFTPNFMCNLCKINDPKEQCFIADIMKVNLKRKKELE